MRSKTIVPFGFNNMGVKKDKIYIFFDSNQGYWENLRRNLAREY